MMAFDDSHGFGYMGRLGSYDGVTEAALEIYLASSFALRDEGLRPRRGYTQLV
jgi:hypothetical protein